MRVTPPLNIMSQILKPGEIETWDDWAEYVLQEAYEKYPETFYSEEHWDSADSFVWYKLTEEQQDRLFALGI